MVSGQGALGQTEGSNLGNTQQLSTFLGPVLFVFLRIASINTQLKLNVIYITFLVYFSNMAHTCLKLFFYEFQI